jgi:DNA-binding CsgD family transcriptional regulator
MPKNLAKGRLLAGRALAVAGRPREAAEALAEGVDLADRLGHASLRWQGRLWLGQSLISLRRDASGVYREAAAQVELLAGGLDDERLRATFLGSPRVRELRDALAAIAAAPTTQPRPAGLTPREVDVLRLLAEHRTDKEIAEALFLGPRTVSTHVANIFNKLGVANRREAAATATRLGIV